MYFCGVVILLCGILESVLGQCKIGIIADNKFESFVNGIASIAGTVYSVKYETTITAPFPKVLTVEATNFEGASGIFISSNAAAYSTRQTVKCIKKSDLFLTTSNMTAYRALGYNDNHWPAAYEISQSGLSTSPWHIEDYGVIDTVIRANGRWVWTDNPGFNEGNPHGKPFTNGDSPIVCRMQLTSANCNSTGSVIGSEGTAKIETSGPCIGGVIVNSIYCIRIDPEAVTWETANLKAQQNQINLSPVLTSEYQNAIITLMGSGVNVPNRGLITPQVWIGGKMLPFGTGYPWRWLQPCCVQTQFPTYEAREQGCYIYDATKGFGNEVTSQIVGAITSDTCMSACKSLLNNDYSGVYEGGRCFCNESMSGLQATRGCTFSCSVGTGTCFDSTKIVVYRYNGISTSWGGGQPNNYDDTSQHCGAISEATYTLDDKQCGQDQIHRYICEAPIESNGACKDVAFFVKKLIGGRCFYLATTTEFRNWHRARDRCKTHVGGDMLSILDPNGSLFNETVAWLKLNPLGSSFTWLGLYREAWVWNLDLSGNNGQFSISDYDYTNFASREMELMQSRQCMYIDGSNTFYYWKTAACNGDSNIYSYATITIPVVPQTTTTTTTSTTTQATTVSVVTPAVGASTGTSSLSAIVIALIVIILLILLAIIIAILIFCCCCKNNTAVAVAGPKKYNARPIAHIPISNKLGEEESGIYVVESEQGSTTNLVADPSHFHGNYRTPRYDDNWGYDY